MSFLSHKIVRIVLIPILIFFILIGAFYIFQQEVIESIIRVPDPLIGKINPQLLKDPQFKTTVQTNYDILLKKADAFQSSKKLAKDEFIDSLISFTLSNRFQFSDYKNHKLSTSYAQIEWNSGIKISENEVDIISVFTQVKADHLTSLMEHLAILISMSDYAEHANRFPDSDIYKRISDTLQTIPVNVLLDITNNISDKVGNLKINESPIEQKQWALSKFKSEKLETIFKQPLVSEDIVLIKSIINSNQKIKNSYDYTLLLYQEVENSGKYLNVMDTLVGLIFQKQNISLSSGLKLNQLLTLIMENEINQSVTLNVENAYKQQIELTTSIVMAVSDLSKKIVVLSELFSSVNDKISSFDRFVQFQQVLFIEIARIRSSPSAIIIILLSLFGAGAYVVSILYIQLRKVKSGQLIPEEIEKTISNIGITVFLPAYSENQDEVRAILFENEFRKFRTNVLLNENFQFHILMPYTNETSTIEFIRRIFSEFEQIHTKVAIIIDGENYHWQDNEDSFGDIAGITSFSKFKESEEKSGLIVLFDSSELTLLEQVKRKRIQKVTSQLKENYQYVFILTSPMKKSSGWTEWLLITQSVFPMITYSDLFSFQPDLANLLKLPSLKLSGLIVVNTDPGKMLNLYGINE